MTPTEQDKKIIRGIEKALEKSFSYQILVLNKECRDELMQLIIADRERVALEARIDEIKLTKGNSEESYLGEDWWADESIKDNSAHEVPLSYFENRIAELKAQQEEV